MNNPPNTRKWAVGDLVIHDADIKHKSMLMRVVGFTRDGLVRTVYCDPAWQKRWGSPSRSRLINELRYLHDPKQFEILEVCRPYHIVEDDHD